MNPTPHNSPVWHRALVAGAALAAATVVTLALWDRVFYRVPFALYFAAVTVAAWRAGWGAGIGVGTAGVLIVAATHHFPADLVAPSVVLLGVSVVVSLVVASRDRAGESLRRTEARHAAVLDAALDCVVGMDDRGRVVEWNPAAEGTFGYARAEALGREMAELIIPPRYREAHRAGLAKYLATGEGAVIGKRFEITAVRKGGDEFPVELTITRVPLPGPPAFTGHLRDLTDRRRADEARRMSEFRFQRLVEQSPLSIQIFAPDGTVRQVNRAWERLWGITLADIPGYNILGDEQLEHRGILAPIRRAFAGEGVAVEPIPYTLDRGRFAGRPRWCGAYVYPVRDDAGAVEEVVLVHDDVTDRRAAEAAAREGAERLRAVFEQSAAGIAQLDMDGRFVLVNQWFCDLLGYSRDEMLRLRMPDITHPDDVQPNLALIERAAAGGGGYRMEKRYVRKDGSLVWVGVSGNILRGAAGEPLAVLGVVTDLTERKRAEGRLARDAMLLANVRDAVVVTDLGGIVTFWNDGAVRLFGWTAEEMLGRPYADRLPEPARTEVAGWIQRIAADGAEFAGEWLDSRKDGSGVWIEATTRRITDPSGEPAGIMGVSRDVSDRKRAEADRETLLANERAARAEAERAGRMKDEFLATLSHELRTPLNAVLGWAQILSTGPRDEADLGEGLRTIDRNARAQAQIIEDLLDMSRIVSGKIRLDVRPMDLAAVVGAAADTVKPAADAKGVRLLTTFDPLVPAGGDPDRLQQVFWNLLSNAVKFTPRGGLVRVRAGRADSHLEVIVTDTGEGIGPDFLPHMFERFRQADASFTRRHGGLGLGLALVKQIVELHGGTVRADSPGPGRGASFTVSLPLAAVRPEPESAAGVPPRAEAAPPGPAPGLKGVRVLVVDDEPDARALVKRVLEDGGAVVAVAGSVEEAMACLAADRPGVLVSDVGMPGADGYELIRRVRALGPDRGGGIPAVALTAYARVEDRARAVAEGFQAHVAKPVEPSALVAIVAGLAGVVEAADGDGQASRGG